MATGLCIGSAGPTIETNKDHIVSDGHDIGSAEKCIGLDRHGIVCNSHGIRCIRQHIVAAKHDTVSVRNNTVIPRERIKY